MAKDYFQDIIPPDENQKAPRASAPRSIPIKTKVPPPVPPPAPEPELEEPETEYSTAPVPERSIRNINVPQRPMRASRPPVNDVRDPANFGIQQLPPKPPRRSSKKWIWGLALVIVIILGGLALFMFRKTTVTVTPRSHTIVFDQTSQFTAYPAATAATGTPDTLAYTVVTSDLQDSEVVPATGSQNVQQKAQGTIEVYNDYSTAPVKFIPNTRFETPAGLIFRAPDAIVIPGKNGTTPGEVSVSVSADQPGQQYNIGPTARFTVPGLQSDAAMYANVYAQSTASTTGGFVGEQPSADPTAVSNAKIDIRSKLQQEAQATAVADNSTSTTVLAGLIQITYQDLPSTTEASGSVDVNENAHVVMLEFNAQSFAQSIAENVSADSEGATLTLVPGQGFAAMLSSASTTLGTDPITFSLSGDATLVWQVDGIALAQALAGHDQNAFDTIANGFPGVQAAQARIEPFWKTSFPSNPADINVVIKSPVVSQ